MSASVAGAAGTGNRAGAGVPGGPSDGARPGHRIGSGIGSDRAGSGGTGPDRALPAEAGGGLGTARPGEGGARPPWESPLAWRACASAAGSSACARTPTRGRTERGGAGPAPWRACWCWPACAPAPWWPLPQAPTSNAHELAQAHKALLVLADLPAGWTSTKNTSNDNNNVGTTQLAHCIGVAANLVAENPPSVNSPQIQDKQGLLMVTDNVTVFPSTANTAAEYAIVTNAKTPGCMTTLAAGPLKAQLFGTTPKGVTIGTPLVSPVASSAFGPGSPAIRSACPSRRTARW